MKFKQYILLFPLSIFSFTQINAQKPLINKTTQIIQQDSIDNDEDDEEEPDTSIVIPDDFDSSLDYLLYSWAVDKNAPSVCQERPNPETTEAEYRSRLKKLPHIIEMPYNSAVKSFIEIYTMQRRPQVESMLGLSKYYFPIFEDALEAAKLPLELKFLPIIESALSPTAVSRAGAAGLWQFMISTGRLYDMEINSLVDERFDPIKSTKAAVIYLKELYSIYGDWNLTIAAYNCGPGNVNKAIRRAGGKRDFWEIYPYLPSETRAYVPIFIAANYTMTYFDEHYLCPKKVRLPSMTDTIIVHSRIYFEQIASVLKMPVEELRLLNPQYKRDIVPGDIKPYSICLPMNYANQFIDKREEIIAYKSDIFNSRRDETTLASNTSSSYERSSAKTSRSGFMYHTVKRGETLGGIAKKYHVTVAQLKRWNNMGKKSKILKGQRLKIRKR